ncbi:hypothetical protein [Thioalkalivibrio sp. ALE16]|uniref:hypothetical protein n=1 Tax=Thioalkalivibrio sp. ALE16 TaxID=1158172 RepID=UPI000363608A|nr:hypothetical protein [Thioalkalivibrio sp. ALE16]
MSMPLSAIAIRSLSAETGESIFWMACRDSGETARVFYKAPLESGRDRPPRVQQFPRGALPAAMLMDLIEQDERDGFVDTAVAPRRLGSALAYANMGHPGEEALCTPIVVNLDPNGVPVSVRNWALTFQKRRASKIRMDRRAIDFLGSLLGGRYPSSIHVTAGSPLVQILAFLQEKMKGTNSEIRIQRDSSHESLPAPSDPVFGVLGLYADMEEDWENPIKSRAII